MHHTEESAAPLPLVKFRLRHALEISLNQIRFIKMPAPDKCRRMMTVTTHRAGGGHAEWPQHEALAAFAAADDAVGCEHARAGIRFDQTALFSIVRDL